MNTHSTDESNNEKTQTEQDGKGKDFISSLFNHNPEIPHLEFLNKNIEANFRYRMTMAGYADRLS